MGAPPLQNDDLPENETALGRGGEEGEGEWESGRRFDDF